MFEKIFTKIIEILLEIVAEQIGKNKSIILVFLILILIGTPLISYYLLPKAVLAIPVWLISIMVLFYLIMLVTVIFWLVVRKKFRIVGNGMIGFMHKCIRMERNVTKRRYIVYRHIPQYMRSDELTDEEYAQTRNIWRSEGKLEYRQLLINRKNLIDSLIRNNRESNVEIKEIYDRRMIEKYASTGLVFMGHNPSPSKERICRLKELVRLMESYDITQYDIRFTDTSPYFAFLICDDNLLIDIGRQIGRNFRGPIGGIYCANKNIVKDYVNTFFDIWQSADSNRDNDKEWLKNMIKLAESKA